MGLTLSTQKQGGCTGHGDLADEINKDRRESFDVKLSAQRTSL